MQTPRLPLNTCEDLFAKLQWDHEQLQQGWDTYRTFNFVLTANHLYQDWIYSAGSETQKQKRTELPDSAKKLFAVWRDIANATKHWSLNQRSQNRQIVDKISEPQIADWYSYFITGPVIYVEVEGALPSITELAELTVQCFNWLLLQEDTDFPSPLDESIKVIFKPISSPPAEV